jgi:hypothetical protein
MAIAVGSQFSMIIVVPLALAFLLYLAPIRRGAALAIWTAACVVALALLFATYFFHSHTFYEGMRHASFWGATWRSFTVLAVYRQVAFEILRACPALALLLPVAITTYFVWPRTRYFGNTAPGLVALLFIGLGMAHPDQAGAGFLLASVPFILIFVSGILGIDSSRRTLESPSPDPSFPLTKVTLCPGACPERSRRVPSVLEILLSPANNSLQFLRIHPMPAAI